ncbi:hypothetical protein E4U17_003081 [Claviceps sp. LM77 group G4]|nr:hypothetical protein E4U17_003081 [Claviceps sp. LM77 group G4]
MFSESNNHDFNLEPYAKQDTVRFSEEGPSVATVFNSSTKVADDSRSSISSDKSDSKPPRSAMRRSSSISKPPQSPRRVRFDFMGEEVLPTSSPRTSIFSDARIPSPGPADNEAGCTSNLATDPGEDEEEPPPRKVSSSDALRALSRVSLDEDRTFWTVVNSDSESSDDCQPAQSAKTKELDGQLNGTAATKVANLRGVNNASRAQNCSKTTLNTVTDNMDDTEDEESSTDEEDFLSMARPKAPSSLPFRAPSLQVFSNSVKRSAILEANSQGPRPSNSQRAGLTESRNETIPRAKIATSPSEEGVFYFEEDNPSQSERLDKQEPIEQEEEEEEDEESESDDETCTAPLKLTSPYATSPAVTIPMPRGLRDEEPLTPSRSKYHSGTVGSYKGRPLVMSVLRNPDILDQIMSSEPIEPIVGSLRDRSPADDSKSNTLAESIEERLAAYAPKSFSERLMIEDIMEAAKARTQKSRKSRMTRLQQLQQQQLGIDEALTSVSKLGVEFI